MHHRREVVSEVGEQRHIMGSSCLTNSHLAEESVRSTALERDQLTNPVPDYPAAREVVPGPEGRSEGGLPLHGAVASRGFGMGENPPEYSITRAWRFSISS
jgi:hypothetical protein